VLDSALRVDWQQHQKVQHWLHLIDPTLLANSNSTKTHQEAFAEIHVIGNHDKYELETIGNRHKGKEVKNWNPRGKYQQFANHRQTKRTSNYGAVFMPIENFWPERVSRKHPPAVTLPVKIYSNIWRRNKMWSIVSTATSKRQVHGQSRTTPPRQCHNYADIHCAHGIAQEVEIQHKANLPISGPSWATGQLQQHDIFGSPDTEASKSSSKDTRKNHKCGGTQENKAVLNGYDTVFLKYNHEPHDNRRQNDIVMHGRYNTGKSIKLAS